MGRLHNRAEAQLVAQCVGNAVGLGDMFGEVTHAFEGCADPKGGDDGAQITGDRLLQCQQVEGLLLDLLVEVIDGVVGRDHGLGEHEIGVEEGRAGAAHGGAGEAAHLNKAVGDAVELLTVGVTHDGGSPFVAGARMLAAAAVPTGTST